MIKSYLIKHLVSISFLTHTFMFFLVSTICTIVLVMLTISEVRTYVKPSTSSMITIQSSHDADKFHINLDVVMPFMPCDVIGLTLED